MLTLLGSLRKQATGYAVSNSLRFRSSASAFLSRTLATPTSATTWTWSAWVKRGSIGSSQGLFTSAGASYASGIWFNADNTILLQQTNISNVSSTSVYRDTSAWYHIVANSNGSLTNCYVNGIFVFSKATGLGNINQSLVHAIGKNSYQNSEYFDGYLAEVNFIDGQALTPASFSAINLATGTWTPIQYTGTYGTNGFYLKFADASAVTAAAIGKDSSGNANNWTPSGISVTAGETYDSMIDSPASYADGGNGRGNYPTFSTVNRDAGSVQSNGNLTTTTGTANGRTVAANFAVSTGKWYWEVSGTSANVVDGLIGIAPGDVNFTSALVGYQIGYAYFASNGNKFTLGTSTAYGASYTTNDIIGLALDLTAGTLTFYKNNVSQGTAFTGLSGSFVPIVVSGSTGSNITYNINFGQRPFTYTPPTDFLALNTQNLPAPAITNPAAHMAATTYTGTGAALSPVNTVNGMSCPPDFVWVKARSGATDHVLVDRNRGAGVQLASNSAAVQQALVQSITAFNTNGFTVGTRADLNTSASLYIAWQWRGGGVGANNTNGSITSLVSANTAAGISIVTWTGSGAVSTIGHGLGVVPKMIIVKNRTNVAAAAWAVYHSNLTSIEYSLTLNATDAEALTTGIWNSTAPTTTVFSTGTSVRVTSGAMVAYCFAEVAGFSKIGKYTGNGSVDGPFVYCGFRPRWLIIKRTDSNGFDWFIYDSARDTYNVSQLNLRPNTAGIESAQAVNYIDFVSNGFKLRGDNTGSINNTSGTFIFMAFAEAPLKYANAR